MEGPTFFQTVVVEQGVAALAPFALRAVESTSTSVRFASQDVVVEFFIDTRSFEVGAIVGLRRAALASRKPTPETESYSIGRPTAAGAFSLDQILKYYGEAPCNREVAGSFVLEDAAQLPTALAELLDNLVNCAVPFLKGDATAFELLGERVSSAALAFTKSILEQDLRKQAQRAWQDRDYSSFVALVSKHERVLTTLEKARLQYALRHLREG